MSEWKEKALSGLANYINGYAFKPKDWNKSGLPIVRIEQINNPNGTYDYFEGNLPEQNIIDNGNIIFSWSATLKVVIWKHGKAALNQHLFKVLPKSIIIDKYFLFQLLDFNMVKLGDLSHGSTMKHIKRGELDTYNVLIPTSLPEQRKIARILSTVDAVIEKTEAAIDKYKNIKAGMMHDLFTRGIDLATGKLRASYEEVPELYKQSELGWMPKEWEVTNIGKSNVQIIDGDRGSNYPHEDELLEYGYCLFLNASNVTMNGFVFLTKMFISQEKENLLGSGKLERNDIIITTRGTVGNIAFYYDDIQFGYMRINSGMLILRNCEQKMNSEFLYQSFKNYLFDIDFRRVVSGSAQPQLPMKDLKSFHLIKPNEIEQKKIIDICKHYDNLLISEIDSLKKYQQLKQALMSDLLTGKVRVKYEEEKEEEL